jgi:hypothetical protein
MEATGGGGMETRGGGGMEASASRTILKYGVITVIGVIPASIVMFFGVSIGSGIADLGVGQTISGAGQSGSIVTFIIGVLIMLVVAVICQLQMITFPIAYAIADSRDDGWRMDYLDTWKTAFEVIFEALPGLGGSFVVVVLGLVIASPSMMGLIGLGLIVSFTGVVWLWLMVIGMVPYIVRKLSMM